MAFAKGRIGVDGEMGDGCWGACGRDAVFDVFFFFSFFLNWGMGWWILIWILSAWAGLGWAVIRRRGLEKEKERVDAMAVTS